MKKSIYTLAMLTLLYGGLTSCKSNTEKQEDAVENVQQANEDLTEVQQENKVDEATEKANQAKWEAFKEDVNATISRNEERIAELNKDIKRQGNQLDAKYQKNVDELQKRNEDLKVKVKIYETDKKQDWESFQTEFNSDMSDLGDALKNFTLNNKK
ncbi:hypothetical protein [Flavobacterium sp.]|uniref:hypothetical protein n=1 Tax=Flavobacterium sp. TaxID=239 RepID=UPI002637F24E|nr:hypothetical protein [Flavobacterium sp.]